MLSLLLSCLSLMLAILPPCMIAQKIKEIKTVARVDYAIISLEVQGIQEKFAPVKDPDAKKKMITFAKNEQKIKMLQQLSVFFTSMMVLTALGAIGTAIYSWDKEHGKEISIGGIITAVVALSWQYIGAGISAGIAVFVFMILVVSFS